MELPRRLTTALTTLPAAVDLREAAAERRAKADIDQAPGQQELASLRAQHAEQAVARQADAARLHALTTANSQVGARLDGIAAALRALAGDGGGASPPDETG